MDAAGVGQRRLALLCRQIVPSCVAANVDERKVCVSTSSIAPLNELVTKDEFRAAFTPNGEVDNVWIASLHYGFLTFKNQSAAKKATGDSSVRVESRYEIVCSPAEHTNEESKKIHISIMDVSKCS